jgi:hypothetical protein
MTSSSETLHNRGNEDEPRPSPYPVQPIDPVCPFQFISNEAIDINQMKVFRKVNVVVGCAVMFCCLVWLLGIFSCLIRFANAGGYPLSAKSRDVQPQPPPMISFRPAGGAASCAVYDWRCYHTTALLIRQLLPSVRFRSFSCCT